MNEQIKEKILAGKFKEASTQILTSNVEDLRSFLLIAAYDNSNITFYGFISYLISLNETKIEWHEIAAEIVVIPLSHIEGAYPLSLFHGRRVLELEPENIKNKEFLLLFNTIPDKLLDKDEAIKLAKEILIEEPKNPAALEIMERYNLKIGDK